MWDRIPISNYVYIVIVNIIMYTIIVLTSLEIGILLKTQEASLISI